MTRTSCPHQKRRFEPGFTHLELAVVVGILVVLASILIVKVEKIRDNADDVVAKATLNTVREAFMGSASAPGYLSDMKYVPGFEPLNIKLSDLLNARSSFGSAFEKYDPVARRGWRGPYISNVLPVRIFDAAHPDTPRNGNFPLATDRRFIGDQDFQTRGFYDNPPASSYGTAGDPTIADHWGNPLVIQIPPDSAFMTPSDAKRFQYTRIVSAGPNGKLDTPLDRLAGMAMDGSTELRVDDIVIFLNRADVHEDEQP